MIIRLRRFCSAEHARASKVVAHRAREYGAYVADVSLADLLERDGAVCGICATPIDLDYRGPAMITVDHVIPLALGGTHEPGNTQPAHGSCNSRKGARITLADVRRRLELARHYQDPDDRALVAA